MIKQLPSYETTIKAIRGGKDPMAFLHLGILYAQGVDVSRNDILANYFLKKALDMGCKEAEEYLEWGYESGAKDFGDEIEFIIEDRGSFTKETTAKVRARVEKERMAKNYGSLSKISKYLTMIYPEYNRNKAIDDILNSHDTIDTDIFYATCTSDNESEIFVEQQDKLLRQLFAPAKVIGIDGRNVDTDLLGHDESELAQCLVNLTESYRIICHRYYVPPEDIFTMETLDFFPYIKVTNLSLLRRQGLRCLLSVKDIEPAIRTDYLNSLRDDKALLDICEQIKDQDMQLFLISFVELNIDMESLGLSSLQLLRAYRCHNLVPIVEYLNAFVNRLTRAGVKHNLPLFTPENLPQIEL